METNETNFILNFLSLFKLWLNIAGESKSQGGEKLRGKDKGRRPRDTEA